MGSFISFQKSKNKLNEADRKISLANEYLASFNTLLEHDPAVKTHSLPAMFLLSHGLELVLKSYLEMMGENNGRKFGHDLNSSWKKAKELGLFSEIPNRKPRLDFFIKSLTDGHEKLNFRYMEESFGFADPVETQEEIKIIRDAVVQELHKQREKEKIELAKKGLKAVLLPAGARISWTRET